MASSFAPQGWRVCTLGQIARRGDYGLVDGPFGSNLPASAYTTSGVPVIRGSNLSLGEVRFRDDEFVFVSSQTAQRLERSLCQAGDIVFTKKGTLGQTGIIPDSHPYPTFLLSSNQMKLSVDEEIADALFVYYYVSSPASRERIVREAEATGVPKTNLAYLRTFPILLPPLPEQRAIARVVGSLDDKIELTRRMNETLEAMARTLFKSWFVDFDPVRARAEGRQPVGMDAETAAMFPDQFEDVDLGQMPLGWHLGTLGDIADNPRRGVLPDEVAPSTPYIGLEHMPRRSIALAEWGTAADVGSNKFQFRTSEILFGKLRPYFHKVGVAPVDGVCSTDILVVVPVDHDWFGYLVSHISSDDFITFVSGRADGTRMPRANWNDVAAYQVVLPDRRVAAAFTKLAEPMIRAIQANIMQSRALMEIRDALLPKLLTGEIRVAEAEKVMETAL